MTEELSGLRHVIQYRRKETADWCGYDPWHTMAAFDAIGPAENYFKRQENSFYEYRLIEIAADND